MKTACTTSRIAVAGALLCLLCLFAPSRCFAEGPSAPKKVVTIEGITEYQLENGARLLLFPDPSSATVTVNLTVFVGSRHEGYGETGMAHLLEHMVFKGTPSHPNVPKALRDHGAEFNGTTWVDRTNYYETMPASDANLEFGIRLEGDRLVNSYVKREDLMSEMTVVRNEFEMGENSPQTILSQRMMAVAYEWHNYGKSTIGNRSDIERVPIDKLQAFYRKYYQPDNVMLVVAGKFDEAKALAYAGKYLGALKRPSRHLEETYTEEPAQDGERSVVLRRVGAVGVVSALYHIPAGCHEDFPAIELLTDILVSEPNGRLYKALVASKKAGSVRGVAFSWHDPAVIQLSAQVDSKESLDGVRETMTNVLERLQADPIRDDEIDRSKRKLLKNIELALARSNRVGIELSEWAGQGDWRLMFLHRDRLGKVTTSDVIRVAARYLQQNNRTVGLYIPTEHAERAGIPATPSVTDLVKNYRGTQSMAAGEAFDPTPANIEQRVQRTQSPTGIKLAFLPKKTRGETVIADLTLRYGNEKSLNGYQTAADFVGSLMMRGTKKHTRQQIEDELDKLKARIRANDDLGELSFTIQAKRETFPKVLELLGEILREPTFPPDEWDVLKRQAKQGLERNRKEPSTLAQEAIRRTLNPYPKEHIRYLPTIEEEIVRINSLTAGQIQRLYKEQVGASAGEFVAVGDFDPAGTRQVVETILKDWKSSVAYQRIGRLAKTDVPGGRQNILTPDKANAVYVAGHVLAMTDRDPDYAALEVANFIFGGSTLASRLGNRVRQKEGLSYGVGSQFNANVLDAYGRFAIFAICNPQNIDKVEHAISEELQKFIKEGVTETELAEAKKAFLQQLQVQRANDAHLTGMLGDGLFVGRTFTFYADMEKRIGEISVAEVNDAVRRHWSPSRLVIVRGGDFKKTAERN
jgi:zinc protease